jgi:hypothetical protein
MTTLITALPTARHHLDRVTCAHTGGVCDGVVLVHDDQSVECSEPGCRTDLDRPSWLAMHVSFISCHEAGDTGCSLCRLAAA